ncbi:hypothetical protein H4W26_001065 [Nesterenkonia halotolerans]|uniref:Uncharacterized protein n=1 Tax=Nesterenkonia halotolerans TaxID=225325 RepID=A0ABR9J5Q4_9MICC|nr:hypothetical protein [Nesterenkonia halotolerans]
MAAAAERSYDPNNRDEVQAVLRREIRAARLKVTLDRALNRPTSAAVKRLASIGLPPFVDPKPAGQRH